MKLIKLVQRAHSAFKYQGNKNKFNLEINTNFQILKKCSKCKKQQTTYIFQDIKVKKF